MEKYSYSVIVWLHIWMFCSDEMEKYSYSVIVWLHIWMFCSETLYIKEKHSPRSLKNQM